MSNIEEYTKNFKFIIPEFNVATWHTEIKENFKAIDALIANFVQSQQYQGAWKQVTQYYVGDLVYISDEDSNNYGGLFKVLVDHITTADDFDTFLGNNPTFYDLQGEMGAQVAALRAQDWAEKIDGKVVINESPIDYSSKAYAIGGVGTETNNSKYFKEQAELARDGILLDPGFIAIKNDMLGDEYIKTVADNISNVNSIGDNILSILSVYNNLSDINICSSNINAILNAPTQATNAQNSATSAAQSAQLAQEAALSITSFDLFDHKWSDHLLNDQNWLRADTFSWQDGTVYSDAYNHLVDDATNGTSQTETISGHTITYTLADDGHKIVSDANASEVEGLYNDTGVAWYYILDLVNHRFKLPRENPAREELIQVVRAKGNGVTLGLTDGTNTAGSKIIYAGNTYPIIGTQTNYGNNVGTADTTNTSFGLDKLVGITTDSTKSGIISSMTDSTSVYKGNKYLYFYVGQFSQSATEQTAGLNAEMFNDKMDLDAGNTTSATVNTLISKADSTAKETIVGWGIPDYTSGIALSSSSFPYTAPSDGLLYQAASNCQMSVNGNEAIYNGTAGGASGVISKGDVVTITEGSFARCYFYPLKGVN